MSIVLTAPHVARPSVETTWLMREIQRAYNGADIRDIILGELASNRTDRAAVFAISRRVNKVIHTSLLSVWIRRLGILDEARQARGYRNTVCEASLTAIAA